MKNQREINGKTKQNKKIGPRKSDVAGDMLDKGDKEAIAPTRHARPIKIKQRRRIGMAISPTGGVFSYLPHHLDLASEDSVGHSTCMSVLARRRAISWGLSCSPNGPV